MGTDTGNAHLHNKPEFCFLFLFSCSTGEELGVEANLPFLVLEHLGKEVRTDTK